MMRAVVTASVLFVAIGCGQPALSPPAATKEAAAPAPAPAPATVTVTMTKERQATITPDGAVLMLKDGNERFASGKMMDRDLTQQVKATGEAQYPYASVLSCIDSRSGPELIFDRVSGTCLRLGWPGTS